MKKIDLGKTVQTLANLGVLAGILLLVYELNQDRDLTTAQNRANISDKVTEFMVNVGSDPQLSSLWLRGSAGERLEPPQDAQFFYMLTGFLRLLENVHYQYRSGLYDETEFRAQLQTWRTLFTAPGYQDYWCDPDRGATFSREFTTEIDGLVTCSDTAGK